MNNRAWAIASGRVVGLFALLAVIGVAGTIMLRGLGFEFNRASTEQVIAASMDAGFTRDQAMFLRHGPMWSVPLCRVSGLAEPACEFFAAHSEGRTGDAKFFADCEKAELTKGQCYLLRNGVKGYREAFAQSHSGG